MQLNKTVEAQLTQRRSLCAADRGASRKTQDSRRTLCPILAVMHSVPDLCSIASSGVWVDKRRYSYKSIEEGFNETAVDKHCTIKRKGRMGLKAPLYWHIRALCRPKEYA
jgi:hypothetical protein